MALQRADKRARQDDIASGYALAIGGQAVGELGNAKRLILSTHVPRSVSSTSLAGICLVPQVYNAKRWDVDLSTMPRILSIVDELTKIYAFAQSAPRQLE